MKNQHQIEHQPVLLDDVLRVLAPRGGQSYLDGTAGYGGHASAIISKLHPDDRVILIDRDTNAIQALATKFGDRAEIIHDSYAHAAKELLAAGTRVDLILLDLGVSSPQIDNPERGFSFRSVGELDMRMDRSQAITASDIVNRYSAADLERIIREYGEEHRARAVAREIVAARPITTTAQLAAVVRKAVGPANGHIDNATRTFQAIRIEVNNELDELITALPLLVELLNPDGIIAVISFHSLEDRIVKQFFETESKDCICPPKQPICTCNHVATVTKLTKSPITGDSTEIASNPRARSAKLRAARKK